MSREIPIWILRANATQPDRPVITFNVLAQGPDVEAAIQVATAEMEERGWSEIDIFRTGRLADDAQIGAKSYLKSAIGNAKAYGFALIRYGAQDH